MMETILPAGRWSFRSGVVVRYEHHRHPISGSAGLGAACLQAFHDFEESILNPDNVFLIEISELNPACAGSRVRSIGVCS